MDGHFTRRDLPHWDVNDATYFITCCLAGSVPATGRLSIRTRRTARGTRTPGQAFAEYDRLLDTQPKIRWLAADQLAAVVRDALLFGHGTRYELLAFVVMPSHFHCVLTPLADWVAVVRGNEPGVSPRAAIMRSIKRHSTRECNRIRGVRGPFWQDESYDRVLRNAGEVERAVRYVEHNPVKAGLCMRPEDWEFSSAYARMWEAGRTNVGAGL